MNRTLLQKEGIKRLQYLTSLGLDKEILKRFKTTGIVSVCEANTTGWRQQRKYENAGSDTLSFFPRTYPLLDYMENVTEDMVKARNKIERLGYLVYLVVRTKVGDKDTLNYLVIDKESDTDVISKIKYNYQFDEFIKGNPSMCFSSTDNKLSDKVTEVKLKMKYGNLIRKDLV